MFDNACDEAYDYGWASESSRCRKLCRQLCRLFRSRQRRSTTLTTKLTTTGEHVGRSVIVSVVGSVVGRQCFSDRSRLPLGRGYPCWKNESCRLVIVIVIEILIEFRDRRSRLRLGLRLRVGGYLYRDLHRNPNRVMGRPIKIAIRIAITSWWAIFIVIECACFSDRHLGGSALHTDTDRHGRGCCGWRGLSACD